eukprot:COSAG02_NODE_2166_length_9611_cov_5.049201_11_plen_68_part_00
MLSESVVRCSCLKSRELQSLKCRAPCSSLVAQIDGSIMDGRAEFKHLLLRAEVWRDCLQPLRLGTCS